MKLGIGISLLNARNSSLGEIIPSIADFFLLQDGSNFLLQNGDNFLLQGTSSLTNIFLLQDGSNFLLQDGGLLLG